MRKGWSFCIVTAPGNEIILQQCMKKIHKEFKNIKNYEIIIVGNPTFKRHALYKTTVIPFKEDFFSLSFTKFNIMKAIRNKSIKDFFYRTGAICHKKNLAAKNAQYDKLCIMHDYVGMEKGWREGFEKFGDDWEVSMNIVFNKDGTRHRDWLNWDHPKVNNGQKAACLMDYDKYTEYMYIPGTYFCVKTIFFLHNLLDEKRFWGEGEDVEWSKRVRKKTVFRMNIYSIVKYLKLKNLSGAPYEESWRRNEKILASVLNKK